MTDVKDKNAIHDSTCKQWYCTTNQQKKHSAKRLHDYSIEEVIFSVITDKAHLCVSRYPR